MERGEASSARVRPAIAFLAAAALAAVLALRGGSYDIVDRQAFGLFVWGILALGLALGLLPTGRPGRAAFVPIVALALLGAWTLASLDWTASDERTLAEVTRVATYAGMLLLVVLAVDRHRWRAAAAGLAAAALLVAALATTSRLAPGLFPDDPVQVVAMGRLNYPFDYWNAVGAWGAMAVSAGIAWSAAASRTLHRAAFLAAVPAAGLSIYLSYSRASIAGLVVGLVLAVALSRPRIVALAHAAAAAVACAIAVAVVRAYPEVARGDGSDGAVIVALALVAVSAAAGGVAFLAPRALARRRWVLPARRARMAGAVAAAVLVVALAAAGPGLADRAWDSFRETDVAASADPAERLATLHGQRYPVWSAALDAFAERSLRGTGAGTFEFTANRDGRSPVFVRDAHSIYIEPLPELGWPGAALTLAFLASVLLLTVRALRSARRTLTRGAAAASLAVLGVWLVQAGVDWMWEMTAVSGLALAGAALAWARLGAYDRPLPLPLRARLPAALGCLLVCALMLPGLASTSAVRDSQAAVRAGDLRLAAEHANDAVSAEPWAVTALLQRAAVAEAAGRLRAARTDARRAAEREPWNWRPPLMLARLEAELGRPAAALAEFRRARRLRPRAVVFEALRAR